MMMEVLREYKKFKKDGLLLEKKYKKIEKNVL
jgi:hypothetical protein